MRYVIAALVAVVFALAATYFVSTPIASAIMQQWLFQDPDTAARLHVLVFLGSNLVGLIFGWFVGWKLGGRLVRS
jgi:predicted lysophospholipase L1 biosynthesis ABC-type transport system permease subunit